MPFYKPFALACMLLAMLLATPAAPARADVIIFAAASTGAAIDEAAALFQRQSGERVLTVYAGSGQLARQILDGAPAALFLSAHPLWTETLEAAGLVVANSRRDIIGNRLALIAARDTAVELLDSDLAQLPGLLDRSRLALGDTDAVPAGIYAKQALVELGLWNRLRHRLAPAANVRMALALVERGEARYGIVYRSDALASRRVRLVTVIPERHHDRITYPLVSLVGAKATASAAAFFALLVSDAGKAIFARHSFAVR